MKRSPLLLSKIAPSPRQPSVKSTPAPATPEDIVLLRQIRDSLSK
jgi:large-conductance mechanosensitive channel